MVSSTAIVANAAIICDLLERKGGTLLITYSGTIDLSTVNAVGPQSSTDVSIISLQSYFQTGPRMIYNTGSTSPSVVLGNGGAVFASKVGQNTDPFHFDFINKTIGLPTNYTSGSLISGEVVIPGSLSYLGMKRGTYVYSWAGGLESVTLNVIPIPEPGSMSIFTIGSIIAGYRLHRRKMQASS